MEIDARRLGARTLEADLCVIGSGPAGLAIAHELIGSGLHVIVLESGDERLDPAAQSLCSGDTIGDCRTELEVTRCRRIGGTPHLWNTWIGSERFARYVPLDAIDFEPRPWLALGGWPFGRERLDPWYERAHAFCGLGRYSYRVEDWARPGEPMLALSSEGFTNGMYQLGSARTITRSRADQVRRSRNVILCSHATVTQLETDFAARRVTRVLAHTGPGEPLRVAARSFVLAAGGIENARLLLLSNRRRPEGLGNRWDMVGRCFMEHPRDLSCRLLPAGDGDFEPLEFYGVHDAPGAPIRGRLALAEPAMRRRHLLNASVTLRSRPQRPRLWNGIWERLPWARPAPGGAWGGDGGTWFANGAAAPRYFDLELHLEQAPDPDNRVVLARSRDALGQPRAELRWRWRGPDRRSWAGVRALLFHEIARSGVGHVVTTSGSAFEPSAHHHMGTTRMSADPRRGVVDANARVHGLANLFVAGSSVFPTAGYANPTLTIVALSLRLADHLAGLLGSGPGAQRESHEPRAMFAGIEARAIELRH